MATLACFLVLLIFICVILTLQQLQFSSILQFKCRPIYIVDNKQYMKIFIAISLLLPILLSRNLQIIQVKQPTANLISISQKIENITSTSNNPKIIIQIPFDALKNNTQSNKIPIQQQIIQNNLNLTSQNINRIKDDSPHNISNQLNITIGTLQINNNNLKQIKNFSNNKNGADNQKNNTKDSSVSIIFINNIQPISNNGNSVNNEVIIANVSVVNLTNLKINQTNSTTINKINAIALDNTTVTTKAPAQNNSSAKVNKTSETPVITNSTIQNNKSSAAQSVVLPIIRNDINVTQKLKTDFLAGLKRFGDSGLFDELIPKGLQNTSAFRKIKNIDPTKTILPQLLQLRKIIRSFDGQNHNQANPNWGKANESQIRHCPVNYADNVGQPVQNLPNPRQISDIVGEVRQNIQLNRQNVTLAFTIWGQFIDHDFQHTPANSEQNLNIKVPKCDKSFDSDCKGQRFIPFSRSKVAPGSSPRLPINDITTWIDASNVYGSNINMANELRSFKEGKLKTDKISSRLLPEGPKVRNESPFGQNITLSNDTLKAGDLRSNENLVLLSLHTLFMRQHNRICDLILRNTNNLTDEEMYTIARNYVTALLQKITFEDFLPILLGKQGFQKHIGEYKGYNDRIDPTMEVQFTTAAYRYGHGLVTQTVPLVNLYGDRIQNLSTDNSLFRPDLMDILSVERVLRGMTRTVTKLRDGQFVDAMRNMLVIAPEARNIRMDLLAINIQRGRDHGLPSYNLLRQCYGLRKLKDFNQISAQSSKNAQIRQVYKNINDVDSYIGIQVEKGVPGSILGQTGIIIIGQQFRKLRDGDRFWYQRVLPPQIVSQIKATKLTHIILRNTAIAQLQEDVFHYSFGG